MNDHDLPLDQPVAPPGSFALDPDGLHVNHGSFGACPRAVLDEQATLRARLEAGTMRFFVTEYPGLLDRARTAAAAFVGADPDGFVFLPNATHGAATVLANLRLAAGDELLTTDHAYRACRNMLDRTAATAGARVVVAPITLPARDPRAPVAALLDRVSARTRLVLVDHITSPTALVCDVAALASALPPGVELLVDGAHAPGQIDLDVRALGTTYYTGNFHKWTCAPKGAGFLWVAPARRTGFHPLVTSHGATLPDHERPRFRLEHDWTGTLDATPYLSVPAAIDTIAAMGGGWPRVRARNRALAVAMRDDLAAALDATPIAADDVSGSMAALAVRLPDGADNLAVQRGLLAQGVEVPIVSHPGSPWPLVRISAHLYNQRSDARRLAAALHAAGVRGRRI
jgi:isopenicillin-N epimerase